MARKGCLLPARARYVQKWLFCANRAAVRETP
jgi:hypothetical protein